VRRGGSLPQATVSHGPWRGDTIVKPLSNSYIMPSRCIHSLSIPQHLNFGQGMLATQHTQEG